MQKRSRVKPFVKFQDRLTAFAEDSRKLASSMPPGAERNDMLKKANQADEAARLDDWARSLFSQLGSP